jgi:hypothetical protein
MAKLPTSARNHLAPHDFAGPHRSFPIFDRGHAEAALIDVGRSQKAGHVTASQANKIRNEARTFLRTGHR